MNHPFESDPKRNDVHEAQKFEIALKSHAVTDETAVGENNSTHKNDADLHRAKQAIAFLHDIRRIKKTDLDGHKAVAVEAVHPTEVSNHAQSLGASFESSDVPTHIGRFEIIEILGRGGFAQVFKARDPKLNRHVALKVPLPNALTSADSQMRFRREAEAAGMLSHPAIVPVFEAGSIGPVSFISYEYCPGDNLAQWFEKQDRRTDLRTAAQIVSRLADAVQHAHQRGVIHRDLKPSNILISGDDDSDQVANHVRITDFGLAKNEQDVSLTREGDVLGTPAYMSPEQATGQTGIDTSSDIYSLGVILYELITGQLPCRKENHVATLAAIVNEEPQDPRLIRSDIPRDISAIALKCLNKQSSQRYPSAHELAADLDAWLDGQTVSARHATSMEKVVRWSRRNPIVAASLTFAVLSLVIGLSLTTWKWSESQAQANRAQRHLQRLDTTIDQILGQVAVAVEDLPQFAALKKDIYEKVLQIQQELIEEESEDLQVQLNTLNAYRKIADIHVALGQNNSALEIVDRAKSLMEKIPVSAKQTQQLAKDRVELLLLESRLLFGNNQFPQSMKTIATVKNLLDSFDDADPAWINLQYATTFRFKALNQRETNQLHAAKQSMIQSLQYARKLDSSDENVMNSIVDSSTDLAEIHLESDEKRLAELELKFTATELATFLGKNQDNHRVRFRLAKLRGLLARVQLSRNFISNASLTNRQALAGATQLLLEYPDQQRYRMLRATVLQQLALCFSRYGADDMTSKYLLESIEETRKLVDGVPKQESLMKRLQWYVDFLARRNLYKDDFVDLCYETEELADEILASHADSMYALRTKTEVNFALATYHFRNKQYDQSAATARLSQKFNRQQQELNPRYIYGKFFEARKILPMLAASHAHLGNYEAAIQYADQIYDTCPYRVDIPYRAASAYAAILEVADEPLTTAQKEHVYASFIENTERSFEVGFTDIARLYSDSKWRRLIDQHRELRDLIARYAKQNPLDSYKLTREELRDRWDPLDFPRGRFPEDVAVRQAQLKSQWQVVQEDLEAAINTLIEVAGAAPESDYVQYKAARYLSELISFIRTMYADADRRFDEEIELARSASLDHLERALQLGFSSANQLRRSDWDAIRDEPRFKACFDVLIASEREVTSANN